VAGGRPAELTTQTTTAAAAVTGIRAPAGRTWR
jgi:hypothetical protein